MENMNSMAIWDQVDLKQDAIIEASAGTGKTYTIQKLVSRLLCAPSGETHLRNGQERLNIEDVLVVTFTDKATEELRLRIRQELESSLEKLLLEGDRHRDLIHHLRSNLANFDKANIQTMHGFCHGTLQQNAFEAGTALSGKIVDDFRGLEDELRREIRKRSPMELKPLVDSLVEDKKRGNLVKMTQNLGSRVVIGSDQLMGESNKTYIERQLSLLEELKQELCSVVTEMKGLYERVLGVKDDFCKEAGAKGETLFDLILSLNQNNLEEMLCGKVSFKEVMAGKRANPINILSTNKSKSALEAEGRESLRKYLDDWWKAMGAWKKIESLEKKRYETLAFCENVSEAWSLRKDEQGHLSYNDMITQMAHALENETTGLGDLLEERYVYGIIDEFQDTDPDQWLIFNRLFRKRSRSGSMMVVGDPKQAIYRFRGADLGTYLLATREMEKEGAQKFHLNRNFRSTAQVINSYNRIFNIEGWFDGGESLGDEGSGVTAGETVEAGRDENSYALLGPDDWVKNPIRCCDLRKIEKAGTKRRAYAEWVLDRIQWLVPDPEMGLGLIKIPHMVGDQVVHTSPKYGDIAVLSETRSQSLELKELLTRNGIPWREFGQEGLLASKACRQWIALLEALGAATDTEESTRRLGLGWFLDFGDGLDGEGQLKPWAREKLGHWRDYADRGKWAQLLQSVVMDSGVEEKLLIRRDGERRVSDLRQIQSMILEHLLLGGEGLLDTARWLRRGLEGNSDDGHTNLHQLESDRSKVVFLTMHKSKGLEFPVVFLQPSPDKVSIRKPLPPIALTDGRRCLDPYGDPHKNGLAREALFERSRLLYVAITRPVGLLFIPLHQEKVWPYNQLLKASEEDGFSIEQPSVRLHKPVEMPLAESRNERFEEDVLKTDEVSTLQNRWSQLRDRLKAFGIQTSFSGMHASKQHRHQESEDGGRTKDKAQENLEGDRFKTSLRPGRQAGNLLHDIFEKEDWTMLSGEVWEEKNSLSSLMLNDQKEEGKLITRIYHSLLKEGLVKEEPLVEGSQGFRAIEEVLKIVRNTLRAPLPLGLGHESIRLMDLSLNERIPELEFRLGMDKEGKAFGKGGGWILGFIDLVFRVPLKEGGHCYFVLDWKSNGLLSYESDEINACMHDHDYIFQAELYTLALHKWLSRRLGEEYCPERHLGGAVYAFVRGQLVEPSAEPFWTSRYTEESIGNIESKLSKSFLSTKEATARWS